MRAEYGAALETLVDRGAPAGGRARSPPTEMALITAGLAGRFGLTEGQTAVLGRAADALRAEREQIGRLDVLVAIGHESRVRLAEQALLRARPCAGSRRASAATACASACSATAGCGFPDELATDPAGWCPTSVARRAGAAVEDAATGWPPSSSTDGDAGLPADGQGPARRGAAGPPRGGFSERDRSLFASLASQLSMGMENARLYHQLDGLFRQYMSPGRRDGPARRPGAGGARRGGRRGDRGLRRPARLHRLLRALHARRRSW